MIGIETLAATLYMSAPLTDIPDSSRFPPIQHNPLLQQPYIREKTSVDITYSQPPTFNSSTDSIDLLDQSVIAIKPGSRHHNFTPTLFLPAHEIKAIQNQTPHLPGQYDFSFAIEQIKDAKANENVNPLTELNQDDDLQTYNPPSPFNPRVRGVSKRASYHCR